MAEIKVLKITPYRGPNQEILEGRKTRISLHDDRLEYSVKYTQKVKVASTMDEGIVREALNHNEEDGFITRESIVGIVKYVDTNYTEDLEAYNVHMVDICTSGTSVTLSIETEAEKDLLYKELHDWKFGKND